MLQLELKQIRIGQACNVITFHNPIRLAEDIALSRSTCLEEELKLVLEEEFMEEKLSI